MEIVSEHLKSSLLFLHFNQIQVGCKNTTHKEKAIDRKAMVLPGKKIVVCSALLYSMHLLQLCSEVIRRIHVW